MTLGQNFTMLSGGERGNIPLIDAVAAGAGTTNLKLCVDVGDSNSLNAFTDETLVDLSPAANDMIAGDSTGTGTGDPTLNGMPGGLSSAELSIHDGVKDVTLADRWTFASNPSWVDNLHKASAQFTIGAIFKLFDGGDAGPQFKMGTTTNALSIGFRFGAVCTVSGGSIASMNVNLQIDDGAEEALFVGSLIPTPLPDYGDWVLIATSIDEAGGAGASALYAQGVQLSTFDGAYSTPSSSAATSRMSIGQANRTTAFSAQCLDCHFAGAFMFEGRLLNASEIRRVYDGIRNRYGI